MDEFQTLAAELSSRESFSPLRTQSGATKLLGTHRKRPVGEKCTRFLNLNFNCGKNPDAVLELGTGRKAGRALSRSRLEKSVSVMGDSPQATDRGRTERKRAASRCRMFSDRNRR